MNGISLEALAAWVIDLYLLSSILLLVLAVLSMRLRQPARRLAVARATSVGLVVLIALTAMPGWPRLSWRIDRPPAPNRSRLQHIRIGSRRAQREASPCRRWNLPSAFGVARRRHEGMTSKARRPRCAPSFLPMHQHPPAFRSSRSRPGPISPAHCWPSAGLALVRSRRLGCSAAVVPHRPFSTGGSVGTSRRVVRSRNFA